MNKKVLLLLPIFLIFLFPGNNVAAQHATVPNDCDDPTQFVTIIADPDADGSLTYDLNEIRVDRATCVELTFTNKSPAVVHDFSVDADADLGIPEIHVHLDNNKAGMDGGDSMKVTFMTPDVDATTEFYCSIAGHREVGMFGDFIIGAGSDVPGFEISIALIAIIALITIPQLRKRK